MEFKFGRTWITVIISGLMYYALYLGFTDNTGFRELITGACVATVATVATLVLASAGRVHFRFRMRDVFQAWHIPWYVILGTVEVLHGLGKQVFRRRGAPSLIAAVPFDPGKHNSPTDAARRALAITFTTETPNSIVLGIVEEQKLLIYHQITPGKVRAMTRNLGARP